MAAKKRAIAMNNGGGYGQVQHMILDKKTRQLALKFALMPRPAALVEIQHELESDVSTTPRR